jgi:CRISPR/Cas system endoribonuclease Cas6 (RAMP superfamily)
MRLKISATSENSVDIPFNYHYYLHSTIYRLINSQIRHFKNIDKFFGVCNEKNPIKYFSFSYLSMYPNNIDIKFGFRKIPSQNHDLA